MHKLYVKKLRCEYKENPIGLDIRKPRLSWQLESTDRSVMQTAYCIQVAEEDAAFSNIVWDTGKVESEQSIQIQYEGPALRSRTRYYYRIKVWDNRGYVSGWSDPAFWETAFLRYQEWTARWITPDIKQDITKPEPCPMLRKVFMVRGNIKSARIYATSLGLYELHLNGARIGNDLFTPGWTSYRKRLQYQTYNVTGNLMSGENCIGIILGDGWYKGYVGWEGKRNTYGDQTAALLEIHLKYEDGREEKIISDGTWKASTGPIRMSDILMGEIYDARFEKEGWDTPEYDDLDWIDVNELDSTQDILIAQENVPVRAIQEIKPVGLITTPAGETVLDMGQNMTGWVRLSIKGMAGAKVILQHAEVLDADGNFFTANLRTAGQRDEYILKGGSQILEPHFTFHGFRYVKVEGEGITLGLDDFTGIVIHSDLVLTGSFHCSDPLINQLQHNILWSQKGNFLDIPTDCPQRDERLGWTGDAQIFIKTACFNMNIAPFFGKWLKDLKTEQSAQKGIPLVIPHVLNDFEHSSAAWGDAAVICPWTLYLCYGDRRILEEQYDSMKGWIQFIRKQGENPYLWNTGRHCGDWLALDGKKGPATPKEYIATAYYAYSTGIFTKVVSILGRQEDVKEYGDLYAGIVESFRREYVTPDGRLAVPTQTAHVLALKFGLMEERHRKRTIETLVSYIIAENDHLSTGFVGTPYLCHALSENGRADKAYQLLLQKDFPSWLYQIGKGATTIWEHWDGIREDGSFWNERMNSFNHYAYGSVGDWLYSVIAGIKTDMDNPGYKHFFIHPVPCKELSYAEAALETMYGLIKSFWKSDEEGMEIEITVPVNTTATVLLPNARWSNVYESEQNIYRAEGITFLQEKEEGVRLELGSGHYRFNYRV